MIGTSDVRNATVKQGLAFAEALAAAGHVIQLSLFGDPESVYTEKLQSSDRIEIRFRRERGWMISPRDVDAARHFRPDVIHVLNPRHHAVHVARHFQKATNAAVVVHWEDDELGIRRGVVKRTPVRRVGRLVRRIACYPVPSQGMFITKRSLNWIRREADACDALTPALTSSVLEEFHLPCTTVLPLMMRDVDPLPYDIGQRFPRVANSRLIAYTGSVHTESIDDFRLAVRSVVALRTRGYDVAFVHAGTSAARFSLETVAEQEGLDASSIAPLGYVSFAEVQSILRQAAVLVQPGRPDRFNRLRLPSKVQAYLASGSPTVMFSVGFGELLEDGREVLKLRDFDADELTEQIARLLDDPELAARVGAGGRAAAERLFSPVVAAHDLSGCYTAALAARAGR